MTRTALRAILVTAVLALPVGGCTTFDPMDLVAGDWFSNKKPLPGDRKDLFPGGVPGVSSGVPADLVKGNSAAALQDQDETPQVRLPEPPKPKPKPKAKPKPKPQVAQDPGDQRRPTTVTVRPQGGPPPQGGVQWPDPPQQRPQAQPQPQGGVQWPDPPSR